MPEISMSGREGSCGKCSGDGVKCSGKSYKTRNSLECLFHTLVYQIQCDRRATQSNVLVHSFVGKRHTHLIEAFHLQAHLLLRHSLKNASIHHTSLQPSPPLPHPLPPDSGGDMPEWRGSDALHPPSPGGDTMLFYVVGLPLSPSPLISPSPSPL